MQRFSIVCAGPFLLAAALAAGCGGGSTTPSPSNPSASPSTSPSPAPTSSSSSTFTFGGSSGSGSFTQGLSPAAVSLPAYNGITLSVQFSAPSSGSGTLNVSDALNNGDVSPNTLPADNATAGATPLVYLSVVNPNSNAIDFGTNVPAFAIVDSSGFGSASACELDVYSHNGNSNALSWFASGETGNVSGTTVTLGPAQLPSGTVDFQPGQQVVAIACH